MKKAISLVLVMLAVLVAGLAPVQSKKKNRTEQESALVFGSIQGVPGLKHIYIQKLGKVYVGNFNRPKTHVRDDGMFFFDSVPPGDYYLAGFSNGRGDLYWFRYNKQTVKEVLFEVAPGGMSYMGSYEVSNADASFWTKRGSFDFARVDLPSELTLLERVAGVTDSPRWKDKVTARLAEFE